MPDIRQPLWRGRGMATRRDAQGKRFTVLGGQGSLLFAPVTVKPNQKYRVLFEMRRESGNGKALCNIYSNKAFDFGQMSLVCDRNDWSLYELSLPTGDFPAAMPMVLRLWRPSDGTGSLHVRRISIEQASGGHADASGPIARTAGTGSVTDAIKDKKAARRKNRAERRQEAIRRMRERRNAPPGGGRRPRSRAVSGGVGGFGHRSRVLVLADNLEEARRLNSGTAPFGFAIHVMEADPEALKSQLASLVPRDWIHLHLDGGGKAAMAPEHIALLRRHCPDAVLTAWAPDASAPRASRMLPLADYAFSPDGGAGTLPWDPSSENAAMKALGSFLGFNDVVGRDMVKHRVLGDFKRVLVISKDLPEALTGERSAGKAAVLGLPFSGCDRAHMAACTFRPDWIHVDGGDLSGPWGDLLLDLRRKLPQVSVSLSHDLQEPDDRVRHLCMMTDFVLVGGEEAVRAHREERIEADSWDGRAATPEELAKLGEALREKLDRRLKDEHGKLVDISIVLGTYNRLQKLKDAVEGSLRSAGQLSVEVIVNDAGSSDGTVKWLKEKAEADKRVRPIFTGRKTSFTEAFNSGLRMARGRTVVWMSDDIVPIGRAFKDMQDLMHGEDFHPSDMGAFPIRNSWGKGGFAVRKVGGVMLPTVGCMFTETLRRYNGINSDYPFYAQDTELDYRVMRVGGKVRICSGARLDHRCAMDELRTGNIKTHEKLRIGDKLEIVTDRFSSRMKRLPYPAVLVRPEAVGLDRMMEVVSAVRKHFSNAHWFLDKSMASHLRLPPDLGFFALVPGEPHRRFDLVFRIFPGEVKITHPDYAEKSGLGSAIGV